MAGEFELEVRAVLFDQKGQLFVLKRTGGKWELPGGKPEPSENFADALVRMVTETTGFTVFLHAAAGTAMQSVEAKIIVHLMMVGTMFSGGLSISPDYEEYRWVSPVDLKDLDKDDWFSEYCSMFLLGGAPPEE